MTCNRAGFIFQPMPNKTDHHHQKRVLGCDPGQSGGLAVIDGADLVCGIRMPIYRFKGKSVLDARTLIAWLDQQPAFDCAVIEAVHAMPRQGVTSAFQFGRMLGSVESIIASYGAPVHYVAPARWKMALGLSKSKSQSIDVARVTFGAAADKMLKRKADDGIAEAALMAAYWRDTQAKAAA